MDAGSNVSKSSQVEDALSDATFRALAESMAAAVFVYQGSRMRYVNAAAATLSGYSAERLQSG